jgi:hypothetical protein
MTDSRDAELLEHACFELARSTKWATRPIDTNDIRALADQLSNIAKDKAAHMASLGADISMVTRAVHNLHQAHAIPPMGDDTSWFSDMLEAMLKVAYPNSGLDGEVKAFLGDLLRRIATFMDEQG